MKSIRSLMIVLLSLQYLANGSLVRNNEVYKSIIRDIHQYFHCKSIVFIHAIPERELFQDIELTTKLFKLRSYFNYHCIPTVVIDISRIISVFGDDLNRLSRPLFVLLNDADELKVQFVKSLAPGMDMSRAKWLIFMSNTTDIEFFFRDIDIPLNCEFCVSQRKLVGDYEEIITEIYRVNPQAKLRHELLASWHPITGIQLPKISLYHLRSRNLHLYTLRAQKIHPKSFQSEQYLIEFTNDVLDSIQSDMNFTFKFDLAHKKGHCWSNGTCDGALGALVSRSTDFIANLLIPDITGDVWKLFDITHPILLFKRYLFIKKLSNHFLWMKYFRPFQYRIWIVIVALIFTTSGFLIFISYHINKKRMFQNRRVINQSIFSRAIDSLFFVMGALCNQGMEFSRSTSILTVQFTICIVSVVILAAYSALLISSITLNVYEPPFTNLEGLLRDGSYKVTMVQNSATYWFFESSQHKLIKTIYDKFLKDTSALPSTHLEEKVHFCQQNNYAAIFPNLVYLDYQPPQCKMVRLETVTFTPLFFFLPRNSPYREFFNRRILLSFERKVYKGYFIHLRQLLKSMDYYGEISVEFHDIAPLLIIHLGGIMLSCVILFIERRVYKNNQRQREEMDENDFIYNSLVKKARLQTKIRIQKRKSKHFRGRKRLLRARLMKNRFNKIFLRLIEPSHV